MADNETRLLFSDYVYLYYRVKWKRVSWQLIILANVGFESQQQIRSLHYYSTLPKISCLQLPTKPRKNTKSLQIYYCECYITFIVISNLRTQRIILNFPLRSFIFNNSTTHNHIQTWNMK